MEVGTGAMREPIESKELNHLGMVAGMFDELQITETIDGFIEQDIDQRKVTIGQAAKAMVINGLGFVNQRLYLFPEFFNGKPVDRLIGEGITAEDLNEHVCGRALDSIFEADPTKVYQVISSNAMKLLNLSANIGHIDTTSFHTDGSYDHEEEVDVININKGYSRDHRPELNQFGVELIVDSQAGIPILMNSMSGNTSDKAQFQRTVKEHIASLKKDFSLEYIVGDSALFTTRSIQLMGDQKWISRVPETINIARELIANTAESLAQECDGEEYQLRSCGVEYAGVQQHWLIIYSPQARARAKKTVAKYYDKLSTKDTKLFDQLCKRMFACETDAMEALKECNKYLKISMLNDIKIEGIPQFKKRGRPSKDAKPDSFLYQIVASQTSNYQVYIDRLNRKSCFILASNQTDLTILPAKNLLENYKKQQKVERGFRFLKDPLFLSSSVFLKSPKRIMALTMIMTICLLVYAALEHRIRSSMSKAKEQFPNQKGVMVNNPTIRWIFQCFQNISVLRFSDLKQVVLNLNEKHRKVLMLLGDRYQKLYS